MNVDLPARLRVLLQHRYRRTSQLIEDSTSSPAPTRSQSTRSRARRDLLHDSTETESKNEHENIDAAPGSGSHDLPEWLEEFVEYRNHPQLRMGVRVSSIARRRRRGGRMISRCLSFFFSIFFHFFPFFHFFHFFHFFFFSFFSFFFSFSLTGAFRASPQAHLKHRFFLRKS